MGNYKKNIIFATITGSKKINNSIIKIFKEAYNKNKKLFRRTPSKFKIMLCETEREFKKEARYYYQKWGTATVLRDNTLVTRSPDFIEKIGRWEKKDFSSIMYHEMNHVFWNDFYHRTTKPVWLLEGFACYAGNNFLLSEKEIKQIIKKYKVDYPILQYRYLARNFKRGHIPIYPVWAAFTRFVAKKYGDNKIVKLMNEYSKKLTRRHYDKTFKCLFGKTEKQLFDEFLGRFK